jgi:hypothetical protein
LTGLDQHNTIEIIINLPKTLLITFFISLAALADAATFRPQVGLGYTSNANYEDTSEDGDLFWQARFASLYITPKYEINLWAGVKDYAS